MTGRRGIGVRLAFALVLSGVLLEALLRIHNPLSTTVRRNRIALRANITYSKHLGDIPGLDPDVSIHLNSLGFRGAEPPAEIGKVLSVVAVGGSTTASSWITDGKTWTDLLGSHLAQSFSPFWINNAGLDGHSTVGHLVLLQDHLAQLRPKVALFLVGVNDLDLTRDPSFEDATSPDDPTNLIHRLENRSEVVEVAVTLMRFWRASRLGLPYQLDDVRTAKLITSPPDVRTEQMRRHEVSKLRGYEQRVVELITRARGLGIEPVLLTQTARLGGGVDPITGIDLRRLEYQDGIDGELYWWALEQHNAVLRNVARQHGVLMVDLAAMLPHSSEYYFDEVHYNNEGSSEVARLVYRALCPFLAAKFTPFVQHPCDVS